MTPFLTMTVPYLRTSPVHAPRRDVVVSAADSATLNVSIIESDDPDAAPLEVTGGIGGPMLSLFIWPSSCLSRSWDYGAPVMTPMTPLWSGDFTLTDAPTATFSITFPPAPMGSWPRRCNFSLLLTWDHGGAAYQIAHGVMNVMPAIGRTYEPTAIVTSDTTSTINDEVLVA